MNLPGVFLEGLTALAFMSGAYSLPEPVQPASGPAVEAPVCQEDEPCWDCETMGNRVCGPVMTIPDMPDPIVVWVEGDAVLSGHYVANGPNSTRLFVDSIEGDGRYDVVCDSFSLFQGSTKLALAVLNGPDGTCRIVEG